MSEISSYGVPGFEVSKSRLQEEEDSAQFPRSNPFSLESCYGS